MAKAYRPFKPGDKVYAVGPGLGVYVEDVGRDRAEVQVDGQSYILSIYKIYETNEAESAAGDVYWPSDPSEVTGGPEHDPYNRKR